MTDRVTPLPIDWFVVGDVVTRDGTDEHLVVATNETDDGDKGRYAPDLIEVECIKEPLGFLGEDGVTRGEPWTRLGEKEWNIPRRYELVRRASGTVTVMGALA